jgi:pyruvate dehydrogenase E1 component
MSSHAIQWHLDTEPSSDPDPKKPPNGTARCMSVLQAAGRRAPRQLLDMLAEAARDPAIGWQPCAVALRQLDPGRASAGVPGRPRDRGAARFADALERAGHGVAREPAYGELGGHIASYASAADLFEVGFNHFFKARSETGGGDLVFYPAALAPGVYARAFLEGRLSETDLAHYRRRSPRGAPARKACRATRTRG